MPSGTSMSVGPYTIQHISELGYALEVKVNAIATEYTGMHLLQVVGNVLSKPLWEYVVHPTR